MCFSLQRRYNRKADAEEQEEASMNEVIKLFTVYSDFIFLWRMSDVLISHVNTCV
jgi:hypothetical protein